ncbi:hypothetical protein Barb7_00525 [Bacteroidales bacterium Barb7]|nr:hypothetical protein Barb7_00525 [Bacteroidales bacterium Barb7]
METFPVQVVPVAASRDMRQRIGEVVRHHFGMTGCAGSEIHDGSVIVTVHMGRTYKRCRRLNPLVKILKAFGHLRPYGYQPLYGGRVGQGFRHLTSHPLFPYANNHLDVRRIVPVGYILFRQQMSSRYDHRPQLVQGNNGKPELIPPLQYQHHHIAVPYPQRLEISRRPVRICLYIGKGEINMFPLVVCPANSPFLRSFLRPGIHYVISVIEIFRYVYLEVLLEIFLRLEGRLI